jgi:tetratricopeptide (TPR) repeat protein
MADLEILLCRLDRFKSDLQKATYNIEDAIKKAGQQNFQAALVRSKIEKGLLLSAQKKYSEAQQILKTAWDESKKSSDIWLTLASTEALAEHYLESQSPQLTIEFAQQAVPSAEKMGLTPTMYRLHSLMGEAYRKTGSSEKARDHFQRAASAIEQIKKETRPEFVTGLLQAEETKRIYSGSK